MDLPSRTARSPLGTLFARRNEFRQTLMQLVTESRGDRVELETTLKEMHTFLVVMAEFHQIPLGNPPLAAAPQLLHIEPPPSDDIDFPLQDDESVVETYRASQRASARHAREADSEEEEFVGTEDTGSGLESEDVSFEEEGDKSSDDEIEVLQVVRSKKPIARDTVPEPTNKRVRVPRTSSPSETLTVQTPSKAPTNKFKRGLKKIEIPLWEKVGVDELTRVRQRFFDKLLAMKIIMTKNRGKQVTKLGEEMTLDITNFFFSDMIGPSAVRRLEDLVSYYSTIKDPESLDKGVSDRAAKLAMDEDTPEDLRTIFGLLSRATVSLEDGDKNITYDQLKKADCLLQFIKEYDHVRELVNNKDTEMIAHMQSRGFHRRSGERQASYLIDYMAGEVRTSRSALSNLVQNATAIWTLVNELGPGVLVVVPPFTGRRLVRWGSQRMAAVYKALHNEIPNLRSVFEPLVKTVLEPIRAGELLMVDSLKNGTTLEASTGLSLKRRIEAVVNSVRLSSTNTPKRKRLT